MLVEKEIFANRGLQRKDNSWFIGLKSRSFKYKEIFKFQKMSRFMKLNVLLKK